MPSTRAKECKASAALSSILALRALMCPMKLRVIFLDFYQRRNLYTLLVLYPLTGVTSQSPPRCGHRSNFRPTCGHRGKDLLVCMKSFLKLIQRPQFAFIKSLAFPELYRTLNCNLFTNISKACPLLETMDMAKVYHEDKVGVRPFDKDLEALPVLFPNLKSIHLELVRCTNKGLEQFVKGMGSRLLKLYVLAGRENRRESRCLDATLKTIGRFCPNLESFSYGFHWDGQEDEFKETVTEEGIISLLQACPKLKHLELIRLQEIGREAFEYMAQHSNLTLVVTGHPILNFIRDRLS